MLSRRGLVVSTEFRRVELVSREIPSWLKLVFKSICELVTHLLQLKAGSRTKEDTSLKICDIFHRSGSMALTC